MTPLFLAPMAGVTNTVFRRLCREFGADVLTSEFVSADGILHRNARTRAHLEFHPGERPFGVQLFGGDPARLAGAARAVVDWMGPDFIDLNFGCPVNKVVCKNGGSSLLRDLPRLEAVARAVVAAAAPTPVTAKIRIGWCGESINAVDAARLLEACGIARLAVHGRTRAQGYSGEADWGVIAAVAGAVRVPVIGNGDLRSGADAVRRRDETAVAGLMVGRAAMAGPWVFAEMRAALDGRPCTPPTLDERWEHIVRHCAGEIAWRGDEAAALRGMRARLMALTRGMPGGPRLRERIAHIERLDEVRELSRWALAQGERPACSLAMPSAILSASR